MLPSQHNPAFQDVAQALGNSLSRDGAGVMRAPLDMGGYAVRNAAAGTQGSDLVTKDQLTQAGTQVGVPIGSLFAFAGVVMPAGYLLCDGRAVSRTTYAALFTAVSTAFGAGDGSTTFNLPDMRGNVVAGKDDMGGTAAGRLTAATAIGTQMGAQAVVLTGPQLASHSHGVSDPGHQHSYTSFQSVSGSAIQAGNGVTETAPRTTGAATTNISIQSAGGDQPHPNVQPSLVANFIIKATS